MKPTTRTFIAVEIDRDIRDRAEQLVDKLSAVDADVKWVEPENMHLTLKFLGEVKTSEISRICDRVQKAADGVEPFDLEVCGAGAFPNSARPRTLWLGSGAGEAEMITLHDRIDDQLAKLSFRPERRRFHPHLTIGRVRRGGPGVNELGKLLTEQADFDAGRIRVDKVVVFSSVLERTGPVYGVLGTARLGGK